MRKGKRDNKNPKDKKKDKKESNRSEHKRKIELTQEWKEDFWWPECVGRNDATRKARHTAL
jgi:hypothetical protein